MNYYDTLILVSDDCSVSEGKVPESKRKKQTIAEIEYRLLNEKPVFYTQDDLQFEVQMIHKDIPESQRGEEKFLSLRRVVPACALRLCQSVLDGVFF